MKRCVHHHDGRPLQPVVDSHNRESNYSLDERDDDSDDDDRSENGDNTGSRTGKDDNKLVDAANLGSRTRKNDPLVEHVKPTTLLLQSPS